MLMQSCFDITNIAPRSLIAHYSSWTCRSIFQRQRPARRAWSFYSNYKYSKCFTSATLNSVVVCRTLFSSLRLRSEALEKCVYGKRSGRNLQVEETFLLPPSSACLCHVSVDKAKKSLKAFARAWVGEFASSRNFYLTKSEFSWWLFQRSSTFSQALFQP